MKHKLFDDWGLKLGSVLLAILIWFIVTNFNDPVVQYRVYNVKVRFINTNVVTDQGQTYEVLDDSNVIDTVTITGPRSVIDALSEDNVVATADFNDLTMQNTITINLNVNKYSSQIESIRGNIDTVKLNIENQQTKILALKTVTSGTVSEGYTIGEITTDENQVRISGPQSLIDEVVRAEVNIPVTGFSQDIVTDADIILLDADGNEVKSDSIISNISKVRVRVELLQTKRVALSFETTGVPADGYEATGSISAEPDSILVAGRASLLQNMDSIHVEDGINITGQTGNMLTIIDITDSLPSGIKLADATFDGKISVTVYIEHTTTRTIQLDSSNIGWENVPDGYEVELVDPDGAYNVLLSGLQKNLDAIEPENVTARADLENILEQEDMVGSLYHVTLSFYDEEDNKLSVSAPVQVWIRLNDT